MRKQLHNRVVAVQYKALAFPHPSASPCVCMRLSGRVCMCLGWRLSHDKRRIRYSARQRRCPSWSSSASLLYVYTVMRQHTASPSPSAAAAPYLLTSMYKDTDHHVARYQQQHCTYYALTTLTIHLSAPHTKTLLYVAPHHTHTPRCIHGPG